MLTSYTHIELEVCSGCLGVWLELGSACAVVMSRDAAQPLS